MPRRFASQKQRPGIQHAVEEKDRRTVTGVLESGTQLEHRAMVNADERHGYVVARCHHRSRIADDNVERRSAAIPVGNRTALTGQRQLFSRGGRRGGGE